jgi:hypothetical protein
LAFALALGSAALAQTTTPVGSAKATTTVSGVNHVISVETSGDEAAVTKPDGGAETVPANSSKTYTLKPGEKITIKVKVGGSEAIVTLTNTTAP